MLKPKRLIPALIALVALFLATAPLAAHADLIVEPDSDFYKQNKSSIESLGRSFAANGGDGGVPVKKEPGARRDEATIKNGTVTLVQYSCLYGGDYWGFTFEHSGWVRLDQMLVVYDYVSFQEDHPGEFYAYDGDYSEIYGAKAALIWPWPGSGEPIETVDRLGADNFGVDFAYRDAENREWGFVGYLYGRRDVWVCLSEPLNGGIPAFNPAPEPVPWAPRKPHDDIRQDADEGGNGPPALAVTVVLVVVLVAGTAVLIRVAWNPGKAGNG